MLILILGIALWAGFHGLKRVAPEQRKNLGNYGQAIVATGILSGLVLMILGYRMTYPVEIWSPPDIMVHFNNFLMVLAVSLLAMSFTRGRMRARMRHPMLTAVKTWAIAHLLVNGDLASIVLFGSMFSWAMWSVVRINRAESWTRPEAIDRGRDWMYLGLLVGLFAIMTGVHLLLGVAPFDV